MVRNTPFVALLAVAVFIFATTARAESFYRGDANSDGVVDISDAIRVLKELFVPDPGSTGLPCRDAADANDTGEVDISDAITILLHLFVNSTELPSPAFPVSGEDLTDDSLDCMRGCGDDCDDDGDGFLAGVDCEDWNPEVNPGAQELIGNQADDDCSARTPDRDRIYIPQTDGTIVRPFSAEITASLAAGPVASVSVANGNATIVVDGEALSGIVYAKIPWLVGGRIQRTLFQGIAVSADNWHAFWVYCQGLSAPAARRVTSVWHLDFDTPIHSQPPEESSCLWTETSTESQVVLPATELPLPALVRGFVIEGETIAIDDSGPGFLSHGGTEWTLLPFQVVDCSDCDEPGNGWLELHTLLWDSILDEVGFGIIYLFANSPGAVRLGHAIVLPTLADFSPDGFVSIDATWTAP